MHATLEATPTMPIYLGEYQSFLIQTFWGNRRRVDRVKMDVRFDDE